MVHDIILQVGSEVNLWKCLSAFFADKCLSLLWVLYLHEKDALVGLFFEVLDKTVSMHSPQPFLFFVKVASHLLKIEGNAVGEEHPILSFGEVFTEVPYKRFVAKLVEKFG